MLPDCFQRGQNQPTDSLTDCGNTIANGGAPAASGCNMLCNGNQTEFCGGGDRLNVYNYLNEYNPTATT